MSLQAPKSCLFRAILGSFVVALTLGASVSWALAAHSAQSELDALLEREGEQAAIIQTLQTRLVDLQEEHAGLARRVGRHGGLLETNIAEASSLREALAGADTTFRSLATEMDGLKEQFEGTTTALYAKLASMRGPSARRNLQRAILQPVFQLAGEDAVGSAVLIHRGEDERGPYYMGLTSYHVVRDILSERGAVEDPRDEWIDVFLERKGVEMQLRAKMVTEDVGLDLALLRIDSDLDLSPVAKLAPLSRDAEIETFCPVYTVGCPLGTAAQATRGEITRRDWQLGGQNLWMVSSPAYFGNSGGGVFLEETHELVGIFAKIYTHGNFRPQVVTHMGLAVPLPELHGWIKDAGYEQLLPADQDATRTLALDRTLELLGAPQD